MGLCTADINVNIIHTYVYILHVFLLRTSPCWFVYCCLVPLKRWAQVVWEQCIALSGIVHQVREQAILQPYKREELWGILTLWQTEESQYVLARQPLSVVLSLQPLPCFNDTLYVLHFLAMWSIMDDKINEFETQQSLHLVTEHFDL